MVGEHRGLQHAAIEIRSVTASNGPAGSHSPPDVASLGGGITAIDEVSANVANAELPDFTQPRRQTERTLIQDDGATVVIDRRDPLAVTGLHVHRFKSAIGFARTAADQV